MVYGSQTAQKVANLHQKIPLRYVMDNTAGVNAGMVCDIHEITYSLMGPTVVFTDNTTTGKP